MKIEDKISKVEKLLKEIKSSIKPSKSMDANKVADLVYNKVMEQLRKEGIGKVELAPDEYILEKFQEKEVKRWEEALEGLDENELKIGAFVLALNKQTTKREIITKVFGKSYTTGAAYQDYSAKIERLVDLEILRADKAKRIYPNLEEKVKEELKTYSPSEEKIQQITDRIKRIFIKNIEET